MSRTTSPSTGRPYGTMRICQLWEVPRSTVYERWARARRPLRPAAKRGPRQAWTDEALTEQVRAVLAASPFTGEGYRKVWARLRLAGVRTSKGRVLRLMREAGLVGRQNLMRPTDTHDANLLAPACCRLADSPPSTLASTSKRAIPVRGAPASSPRATRLSCVT